MYGAKSSKKGRRARRHFPSEFRDEIVRMQRLV